MPTVGMQGGHRDTCILIAPAGGNEYTYTYRVVWRRITCEYDYRTMNIIMQIIRPLAML